MSEKKPRNRDGMASTACVHACRFARRNIAHCPITGNLPTRMTETAFRRHCAIHQVEPESYCSDVCRGELLPAGLEFIEPVTNVNEVETMPQVKSVSGKCSLCDEKKLVRKLFDKFQCATCETIRRAAKNAPELTVRALIEENGQEWVDKHFTINAEPAETMLADLQATQKELENSRENSRKLIHEIATELGFSSLSTDFDIATEFSILKQENDRLREQSEEYGKAFDATAKELDFLRKQLSNAALEIDALDYTAELGSIASRDTGLLDLALDVLDGKVTGLDSARLRALR